MTSGFIGVWLDRFGYDPAELATLESALTARLGPPLVGGLQQRYAYFDLSSLQPPSEMSGAQSARYAADRDRLLNPLLMTFGPGFYDEERDGGNRHWWSRRESTLRVQNDGETLRTAVFHALIQAGQAGVLRAAIEGRPMDGIHFLQLRVNRFRSR